MKRSKILSIKETQLIYGSTTHSGKYYGNGVHCAKNKCMVDRTRATTCIAGMSVGGFLGGTTPGKC